jgi:iron complex outermembrane receptor protein
MAWQVLLCAAGLLITAPALALADSARFDIAAQPLPAALKAFATQAHMQLLYQYNAVRNAHGNAVSGDLEKHTALEQLLRNTGLEALYSSDSEVTIRPVKTSTQTMGISDAGTRDDPSAVQGELPAGRMRLAQVDQGSSSNPAPAAKGKPDETASENKPTQLEEVTVTATKTGETSLQATPLAITAFTADQLSQRAIQNVSGIAANTPGLELTDLSGYSQLFIRGVGSNTVYVGSDPSSTINIDGVYQARPLTLISDFLDVDRVEVLKGPQGTLYGRNSVGGTVNVISRAPSDSETGEVQLSAGNYGEFGLQAYMSGPLGDSGVLGSLAVSRLTHDDYLENVSTGGGLENADHYAARGQLLFPLGSEVSLILRGNYAYAADALGGDPKLLEPDHVPLDDSVLGDYFKISTNQPAFSILKEYGFSADLSFHPSNDLTVKSLTAYQAFSDSIGLDADSSSLNLFYTTQTPIRQHQFSEELNANGNWNALTYVAGAYYFTENDAEPLYLAIPAYGVSDVNIGKVVDTSEALYGQTEYHFTSKLSAIVGLRYTHETKDYDQSNMYHASGSLDPAAEVAAPVIGPPFFPPPFAISTSRSYSAWTPKFGLNFWPQDNVLTYASITKGFKSGGFDFGSPTAADATRGYNPEYLWAYELGVKSDWLDHRLRLNVDGFLYHYSDMQVEVFVPPANAVTENAATARLEGVEAELAARPVQPLELYVTVAYLHAHYLSFPAAYVTGFGTFNATGQTLNYAPEWSSGVGATYHFDLLSRHGSEYVGVDYHAQSREYFTPANGGVGGVTDYGQQQEGYGVLGARLGWNSSDSRWNVAVIGLNLTNRQYVTGTVNYTAAIAGRPGDPRTVRGQFSYKF